MAVMQNSIIFGGIDSADFGIYIGGEGVFNAPKRAVEMVTVPGRNGDIAIDQGHYENIEVTYSAFNYEEDLATFAQRLSDFRNALASQIGYQQLSDTFHPNEYRMALFVGGLEIDPIKYNTASTFEIKFDCKPQRWLTSGEIPVTIGEWGATKEASGEIVTIESEGGEAAKSLVVTLEPIQSLNGYDAPWIGGAGKNLCKPYEWVGTNAGVQFNYTENGVTLNGTATQYADVPSSGEVPQNGIFTLKAGTYKPSTDNANVGIQIVGLNPTEVLSRNGNAFTLASDRSVFARASVYSGRVYNNLTVHLQLEAGSTATAYEPYENICPISGRTKVVTSVAGKNLLPMTLASLKAVNTSATWSGNTYTRNGITFTVLTDAIDNVTGIRANGTATAETTFYQIYNTKLPLASGQYAFNGCPSGGSDTTYRMQARIGSAWFRETGSGGTFTYDASTTDTDLVRISILQGAVCNNLVFKPMIRLASDTDDSYEPYNGNTYTTSLGRTVYGGTLDVVSGMLTVDMVFRTFDGSENWETINQGLRLAGGFGGKAYSTKDLSNMLTYATSDPTTSPNSYKFTAGGFINVGVPYTVAEWKSLLATTNLQIVYELATPQTYQLTPQQIELLLGENHVWSDGAITMQYGDDPNSLWNPTQYDAGPLLAIEGNGNISFNGYTVVVDAGEYGLINVKGTKILSDPITYSTKTELYNSGDTIEIYLELHWELKSARSPRATRVSNLQNTGDGQTETQPFSNGSLKGTTIIDTFFLSSQDTTRTNVFSCDVEFSNGHTATTTLTLEVFWDSANSTLSFHTTPTGHGRWGRVIRTYPTSIIEAVSSKTYLGDPTYVDCEIGEAYKIEDGEIVSLNKYIELGSDLPKLSSGANDVTISDTVTELKVTPNWWKL